MMKLTAVISVKTNLKVAGILLIKQGVLENK